MTDPLDWDLDEVHLSYVKDNPQRKVQTNGTARCVDCGLSLDGPDRAGRRCDAHKLSHDAEVHRARRAAQPKSATRTFTCHGCNGCWSTDALGNFKLCPVCRVQDTATDLAVRRTRVCTYRHCGKIFTDGSSQNTAKFCSVECRRREKLFRNGIAKDVSYFRKP